MIDPASLVVQPVTPDRWAELEILFQRGWCAQCWCMWWRITRREFDANGKEGNRAALRAIVEGGQAPGLIAALEGKPVGWVSVGPREVFSVLQRSPVLKPVDDLPVWSVVCFVVAAGCRRQGISSRLLGEAVAYARANGARAVEGYPVDAGGRRDGFSDFTGFHSTFVQAGFAEVARRSEKRPIMRLMLDQPG
jgi:GNAT superfamily N-acetyltransferase